MSTIEDLLEQSIKPAADSTVERNWESVVVSGEARQRRRSMASGVAVVGAISVLFIFLLQAVNFDPEFDVLTTPPEGDTPPVLDPTTALWPTTTEVFALAGSRPRAELFGVWIVVLLLPLLAAWFAWARSATTSGDLAWSVTARFSRATGAALFTIALFGLAVGVALMFLYDPLAAQTGTSWLVHTMAVISTSMGWFLVAAIGAALAPRTTRRWVLLGVYGWAALLLTSLFSDLVENQLSWHQTIGNGSPSQGLWRVLLPGDSIYLQPGGTLSALGAWFGVALALLAGGLALAWGRRLATTPADAITSPQIGERVPSLRAICWMFALLAAGTLMWAVSSQDVRARESLYVVTLPTEITDAGEVTVTRTIDRNIFDENSLFELEIRGGDTPITDVSLHALFGDDRTDIHNTNFDRIDPVESGAELVKFGRGIAEIWEIERNEEQNVIHLRAATTVALPGLNTLIFLGVLLVFGATSRRLRNLEDERVPGRLAAAWLVIIGALVIAVRLIQSLSQLEGDVGDRASRNDLSLYDVYTAGGEADPVSLHALSGWFFPFNVAILLPLFGLALIGMRRLGASRRAQGALGVLAILSTVVLGLRFGALINDWVGWFLD